MIEAKDPVAEKSAPDLDSTTIFLHAGIMVLGVLAWLTGYLAGDYKHAAHGWFSLHKWLGISLAALVAARLLHGFWGPESARFSQWVPYTPERRQLVIEDLGGLLRFKLPQRPPHQGLAGLWEAFGLAVFTWMAATGALMFLFLTPGRKTHGLVRLIKELHEVGEWLVPLFLGVHVAAVALHALAGDHRWRKVFFLED
jgi:cytochrome b